MILMLKTNQMVLKCFYGNTNMIDMIDIVNDPSSWS